MSLIGISGLARSGKDSFYERSIPFLKEKNLKCKRLAFADELKRECNLLLRRYTNVSAFTTDNEEKKMIRPLLISYGTHIRRRINPNCWIESIEPEVINKLEQGYAVFITDVRYQNEIEWLHKLKGKTVHIERVGVKPPNREEELNDPILKKKSTVRLQWDDFLENEDEEISKKVKETLESIL